MFLREFVLFIIFGLLVKNIENYGFGTLPKTVKPIEYDLDLIFRQHLFEPSKAPQIFEATVIITFINNSSNPVNSFEIHYSPEHMNDSMNVILSDADKKKLDTPVPSKGSTTDSLRIGLSTPLEPGKKYSLTIKYNSTVNVAYRHGLYKSAYIDKGQLKYLLATYLMPTYARTVFPCFDEPMFKASFKISVTCPKGFSVVSNMKGNNPVVEVSRDLVKKDFPPTPVMSSFLITVVVCEFKSFKNKFSKMMELYMKSETRPYAFMTAIVTMFTATIMGTVTGVNYTQFNLNQAALVAIPDVWESGTDNWGAATFRENDVLWSVQETAGYAKQAIAVIISKKVAKLWFGNLVTYKWFSDLFISEGIATFMSFFCLDKMDIDQSRLMMKQFVGLHVQRALYRDSMSSHPLSVEVHALEDVLYLHRGDCLVASKGGSIMRMLFYVMGPELFVGALRIFIKNHMFGNADHKELWKSFDNIVMAKLPQAQRPPVSLSQVMEKWTLNASYPLIRATLDGSTVTLTQKVFDEEPDEPIHPEWYIPISFILSTHKFADTTTMYWMEPEKPLVLKDIIKDKNDWIIINTNQAGYYRIDYDDDLMNRIKNAIVPNENRKGLEIPELNKAQFVDDLMRLATFNKRSYTSVFKVLREILKNEKDYFVWYSTLQGFKTLFKRTAYHQVRDALSIFLLEFLENLTKHMSYEEEWEYLNTLKQHLALNWACLVGEENCIYTARGKFDVLMKENIRPHSDIRFVVYCNVVRWADGIDVHKNWDWLWEEYQTTPLPTEKILILEALGCIEDKEVLQRYLRFSIEVQEGAHVGKIRKQDLKLVFSAVANNSPQGPDVVLDFLIDNFEEMYDYLEEYDMFRVLFSIVSEFLTKPLQVKKLRQFIRTTEMSRLLKKYLQRVIQDVEIRMQYTVLMDNELLDFFNISLASEFSRISEFIFIIFIFMNYLLW